MTNISDGSIINLLDDSLKNVETECLAYAVKKNVARMQRMTDKIMILSSIDTMTSDVLDALAVELRAPYYLESMTLQAKRESIKNSFTSTFNAGTKAAVKKLIDIVFGDGKVIEWSEENGPSEPGTFDVEVTTQINTSNISEFTRIIEDVKNIRSHIVNIRTIRPLTAPVYYGVAFRTASKSQGVYV